MNNGKTITMLAALALALCLAAPVALAQQQEEGDVLLQEALHKEMVDGELELAIALYQRIVQEFSGDRPLAAKALMQMGKNYEKLGRPAASATYEQVLRDYADQREMADEARVRLAALRQPDAVDETDDVVVRQVWAPAMNAKGGISPDGRYLSFVDWPDLAIRDLTTGENRRLTNKGTWAENPNEYAVGSIISPDGKQVAYTWFDYGSREHCCADLRIIALTGEGTAAKPRILYRNEDVPYIQPFDWSPDGEYVLALFTRKDQTNQIGLISIADGSVQVLKTFDWRYPANIRFSPDGRFIVYDFPTKEDAPERDIFVLAADGSHEMPLVEHPSDDYVLGWAPDGTRVLFASDRTGSWDAWLLPVADGKPQESLELVKRNIGRIRPMGFTGSGSFYYGVITGTEDVYITTLDPATGEVLAPPEKISQRFQGQNRGSDWSPDGQYLAYASRRDGGFSPATASWTLVIRSIETGQERAFPLKLTPAGRHLTPRWSPDGRSLLVVGKDDKRRGVIYRIDAQTGTVTPLVQIGPEASIPGQAAVWSRDGKAIFYPHYDRTTNTARLLMQDLETGQEKELYRPSSQELARASSGNYFRGLALSPDGRQLVLCRSHDLKVLPTTGGEPHELLRLQPQEQQEGVQIMNVAWTPDGRHVLFTKGAWPKLELWRISAERGVPQRLGLAMDGLGFLGLSVHPDGRRLAFNAGKYATAEVWVMEHFLPGDEGTK